MNEVNTLMPNLHQLHTTLPALHKITVMGALHAELVTLSDLFFWVVTLLGVALTFALMFSDRVFSRKLAFEVTSVACAATFLYAEFAILSLRVLRHGTNSAFFELIGCEFVVGCCFLAGVVMVGMVKKCAARDAST